MLWEEVASLTAEYRNCIYSVRLADAEYLELVKQLNVNKQTRETDSVTLKHPQCEVPLTFVIPQVQR